MWLVTCLCGIGAEGATAASRIVSLDYCADQFVLKFAQKDSIVGLSPDAARDFSYMRAEAFGMPTVRPIAEDVIIVKPDLVVRSYGGNAGIVALLKRFGVPVLQLGYAEKLADVRQNILHMSAGLGSAAAGRILVEQMDERLRIAAATKSTNTDSLRALYMTPGGVTSGPNTLVHEMIQAAGYLNYQAQPGWHELPLERLIFDSPELVAMAYFEKQTDQVNSWSAMRHPVARRQLQKAVVIPMQGAWTACGGWFLMDAIEKMQAALVSP